VTESAGVSTCPNCGAPFELDAQGRCRWCQAVIKVAPPPDPLSALLSEFGATAGQHPFGAPDRPMPGMAGGGLTPEQAAAAISGGGTAMGMQSATASVLAVAEVPIPPGMPGAAPAGTVDLTLEVALPAGGSYSTSMRIGFGTPQTRAKVARVGATLPVMVNPANPDQIAVDTSKLP
jgi:hypothetical protein